MDFPNLMRAKLKTDLPEAWHDSILTGVEVHRQDGFWYLGVSLYHPVPRTELERVAALISQAAGVSGVVIVPKWPDPEACLAEMLSGWKEEISGLLAAQGVAEEVRRQTAFRVAGRKLEMALPERSLWDAVVGSDACCRLADWVWDNFGVTVLVKATCTEQSCCENIAGTLIMKADATPAFIVESDGDKARAGKRQGRQKDTEIAEEETLPLAEVQEGMGKVVVKGRVFARSEREIKGDRRLITYWITDLTDSLIVKHFVPRNAPDEIGQGDWAIIKGSPRYDNYEKDLVLIADVVKKTDPQERMDDAPAKRVELHAHTVMSALDGMTNTAELVKTAARWGHSAIAITDHGVVQAFPEAYQVARKAGIKVIFGMEGYLIDEPGQSRSYHIIILARNDVGLKNLYRLVSISHLDHFYRRPRIPRSILNQHREGLILGTACEAGELFQAALSGAADEELERIASFYDYIEVQPLGNNEFMLRERLVGSREDLEELNRRLVHLGERMGKPVVATGDVHFLNPEDEVFRRILQSGKNMEDAEIQAPLYLRTTTEMLSEFCYLDDETAYRIVVENPEKIAGMVETLKPVPDELYTPEIDGADEYITQMAQSRAYEIYGTPLPEIVESRLARELESIVGHGFSNLYYIAQKLVEKSNNDGYLVGSRGSVGSSFVAFLVGITEVNPLAPHYVCPQCRFSQFLLDGSVGSGADMEPRDCPECGTPMRRDGFDIPFETFLGFDGDKVPDIDLNFSGEYQPRAHQYVEELFGRDKVFRAGTISTIAEKTGYGFVKKYMEQHDLKFRTPEIARLAAGLTGVKRTTGQHPGGLMIVPRDRDVHEFTPLQHPADDTDSSIVTTHFDYHSISERLVKVDILGHDDPTMIRTLTDLTGFDARKVPLDEPAVMSLFAGTEALGVTPEQIGSQVGTFGIPEFGTRFVRQMLEITRPRTFSELIRISGLSHGTNVWLNNAQTLIQGGTATLSEVIATRDDIMGYLIHKGLPKKRAFKIMENVRKGKGLSPEDVEEMSSCGVPDWYIDSCQKIEYMFPKAHAVAYVMMAFRIAYYKVYYPEAFYAAFFSVRAEDFDHLSALSGSEAVRGRLDEIDRLGNNASPKEKSLVPVLELTLEALERGITFLPVDLYDSDAERFLVTQQGIRVPFTVLPGLGAQAARSICRAREQRPFVSVEDLQIRAHLSSSVVDILRESGCLEELPQFSQISLFG